MVRTISSARTQSSSWECRRDVEAAGLTESNDPERWYCEIIDAFKMSKVDWILTDTWSWQIAFPKELESKEKNRVSSKSFVSIICARSYTPRDFSQYLFGIQGPRFGKWFAAVLYFQLGVLTRTEFVRKRSKTRQKMWEAKITKKKAGQEQLFGRWITSKCREHWIYFTTTTTATGSSRRRRYCLVRRSPTRIAHRRSK